MGLAASASHGWNFMFLQIKVLELSFRTVQEPMKLRVALI